MALTDKSLASISESDLRDLITNKVREGKEIDYKQSLPGNADSDKKEFLADVSSFSNTNGGHLIYGMKESGGVPTEIPGVSIPDIDATIQRFENLIRDGLQPRLNGVQIVAVQLAN
jgi:predicted HTH transcriptional regulator